MSKQITGRATIRVNGKVLKTENGATLNPGGSNRKGNPGGGTNHGYQEEDVIPSLECSVFHMKDTSLRELSDITDATIMFETDTGVKFTLREAYVTEPAVLDAGSGMVPLKFEAIGCDED